MKQKQKMKHHKLSKLCCLFLILMSLIVQQSFAITNGASHFSTKIIETINQDISVSGKVVDESGVPIPGVNVLLKTTKIFAVTDFDGNYIIKIPTNVNSPVLAFSFIGFKDTEITINNRNKINVTLVSDVSVLDEVVVIGYGSVAKKDLTGSVGTIQMQDIAKAPVISFDQALAGRVAGVNVTTNDGQPGAEGLNIVIRGANSLTQNNGPLYVVDGFPLEDFNTSSINPEDIESITILKDASSTAIYGARGANGVIVIQTKKGTISKPTISYNTSSGFNEITKTMDMMNAYEYVQYELERNGNSAMIRYTPADLDPTNSSYDPNGASLEDYKNSPQINWQDYLFKTGTFIKHSLSLRGGNQNTKYSVTGSIYDTEGVIINSGSKRYQGSISLDQRVNDKLKTVVDINYSSNSSYGQNVSTGGGTSQTSYLLYSTYGLRPIRGINDNVEELLEELVDEDVDLQNDYRINPIVSAKNELRKDIDRIIRTNAYVNYAFNDNLELRIQGGLDTRFSRDESFYNTKTSRGTPLFPNNDRGVQGSVTFDERNVWSNENTLKYKNKFKSHRIDALLGTSLQSSNRKTFGLSSILIPNESLGISGIGEGVPQPNRTTSSTSTLESFFGRVNYNYNNKYYLTATYRADGSSRFAPGNKWGYFPSGAFAWRMNRENFLKKVDFISEAKLRISYGESGNNRVSDYAYLAAFDLPISNSYSFNNGQPSLGIIPIDLSNDKLKWETTSSLDIGYDLSLFKERVNLTVDWYRKNTKDLLLNANIPYTSGYRDAYRNVGEIQNQGLEFSLTTINVKAGKFEWNTNFNISFNNNKILALSGDEDFILSSLPWDTFYRDSYLYIAKVGQPASQFFGFIFDGIYQISDFDGVAGSYSLKADITTNGEPRENINPGDIKYKDLNGDLVVDSKDQTVIGRTLPKHTGGLTNNFSYGGFDLSVFLQWSYGNDVFNANRISFENERPTGSLNQFASYVNRWTPDNPSNTLISVRGQGPVGAYSSRVIEDGSFIRLKTVSLGYSFPKELIEKLKISALSLSLSAQNLITWTKYTGMDPEVNVRNSTLTPGFDFSAYPRARTMVLGVNVNF